MMIGIFALLASFCASPLVNAAAIVPRQSIGVLSAAQVNSYTPYTHFASAGYCTPDKTIAWNCGAQCDATRGFVPIASGGDGSSVQYWYVGYYPTTKEVIVVHQGTNPKEIEALTTDAKAVRGNLDPDLFPGLSDDISVHDGFKGDHAKTAAQVLAAVKKGLAAHNTNSVAAVGHSLGAALSLLDSVYLRLQIPGVKLRSVLYGLPRVGNDDFANYVDAHSPITHINNKKDLVPILPGRFLGYHHPSGEIHIQDSGEWDTCPGQDNTSDLCTTGAVPNIFDGSIPDHDGPYNGIEMGC